MLPLEWTVKNKLPVWQFSLLFFFPTLFCSWNPYPYIYLQPSWKGTPFERSLPMLSTVGSIFSPLPLGDYIEGKTISPCSSYNPSYNDWNNLYCFPTKVQFNLTPSSLNRHVSAHTPVQFVDVNVQVSGGAISTQKRREKRKCLRIFCQECSLLCQQPTTVLSAYFHRKIQNDSLAVLTRI